MHVKVKFTEGFKDGTIFDRSFAPGDVTVVTEQQLQQVQRSGGVVEVLENVIANPLKAQKEADEAFKRERSQQNDPQNAENSLNDLPNHVPGLEDEVEEVRLREAQRRADPKVKKVGSESVFNDEPARADAEARAKVEEAMQERKRAHEADLEKGRQEELERLEAQAKQEAEEAKEAKVALDAKKKKK